MEPAAAVDPQEPSHESREGLVLGVVEGFYGKPWTFEQRKRLFAREREFGLTHFMYAPKDEVKHRRLWREPHDEVELLYLRELVCSAADCSVAFVYAISPGLDMVYSCERETRLLVDKLRQVYDLGCRHFALLFDDINTSFTSCQDHSNFSSLAAAQVSVSNAVRAAFSSQPPDDDGGCTFMFCPTEYCTARAFPSLQESEYLHAVGAHLHPQFHVFWTGESVIPETMTAAQLRPVQRVLRRKPLIWDNIHANDYDPRRVFLGPYCGRDPAIIHHVSGVLSNPNNQFECNYVPLLSFSMWARAALRHQPYSPAQAQAACVDRWRLQVSRNVPCEERVVVQLAAELAANDPAPPATAAAASCSSADEGGGGMALPPPAEYELDPSFDISAAELATIVAFNFMPNSSGPAAERLLADCHALADRLSAPRLGAAGQQQQPRLHPEAEPEGRRVLAELHALVALIDKMADCPNRQLAFELFPIISETRMTMTALGRRLGWLLGDEQGGGAAAVGDDAPPPPAVMERQDAQLQNRRGINGHFNRVLAAMPPADTPPVAASQPTAAAAPGWSGGVMILPLVARYVQRAAHFLARCIEVGDEAAEAVTEALETLLHGCSELCPVLCYVMLDSQDHVLAVSVGCPGPARLLRLLQQASGAISAHGGGQPPCPYLEALVEVVGGQQQRAAATAGEDGQQQQTSSIVVFASHALPPKLFENFVHCISAAIKALPGGVARSHLLFERRAHTAFLASLQYRTEEGLDGGGGGRFTLYSCAHLPPPDTQQDDDQRME